MSPQSLAALTARDPLPTEVAGQRHSVASTESPDLVLDKLDQLNHDTPVGAAELALGAAKGLSCRLLRSAAIEAMIHPVRLALAFAAQGANRYAAPDFWGIGLG